MPKISAPSVAEHVAQQEALVFDTAVRLFTERGYSHVTLGDIAAEVGLKRNSLYRYFPSKAHILVRWFRAELPTQAMHSAEVLTGTGPPLGRIVRWADDQLDYALRPEHALIAALSDVVPDLDPETRTELASSHALLMAPLRQTLVDAGITAPAALDAAVELIGGLVLGAAQREARVGRDEVARSQLAAAIGGLLAG
jgi:AcrR family transcriptional regulator